MWSQLPTVYKIPKLKPSQIKEKQVRVIDILYIIIVRKKS